MDWAEIKGPFFHPDSLTQGVVGSNPFTVMRNIFVTEFTIFNWLNSRSGIAQSVEFLPNLTL